MLGIPNWVWQIVNFLILLILLRKFLFRPVTKAMDRRAAKIAAHFDAAEQKETEAIEKSEALDGEKKELQAGRDAMLAEAKADAEKLRHELSEKAREEVAAQAERWHDDLRREKDAFVQQMQKRIGEQVCTVAAKALEDLASADLERAMVNVLVGKLESLPDEERKELVDSINESGEPVVVATAWELPGDDRERATAAVRKHIAKDASIEFAVAPELTCGVELRVAGREIAWTVESYVQGLGEALTEAIDNKARKPEPKKPKAKKKDAGTE